MDLRPEHKDAIFRLIERTREFSSAEQCVAKELVEEALKGSDYRVSVEVDERGDLLGYVCFGQTPMTEGAFDLYWIAVDPHAAGRGIGRRLVRTVIEAARAAKGRLIRVETEGAEAYASARGFYAALDFEKASTLRDFYRPGADLVTFVYYL